MSPMGVWKGGSPENNNRCGRGAMKRSGGRKALRPAKHEEEQDQIAKEDGYSK